MHTVTCAEPIQFCTQRKGAAPSQIARIATGAWSSPERRSALATFPPAGADPEAAVSAILMQMAHRLRCALAALWALVVEGYSLPPDQVRECDVHVRFPVVNGHLRRPLWAAAGG